MLPILALEPQSAFNCRSFALHPASLALATLSKKGCKPRIARFTTWLSLTWEPRRLFQRKSYMGSRSGTDCLINQVIGSSINLSQTQFLLPALKIASQRLSGPQCRWKRDSEHKFWEAT